MSNKRKKNVQHISLKYQYSINLKRFSYGKNTLSSRRNHVINVSWLFVIRQPFVSHHEKIII